MGVPLPLSIAGIQRATRPATYNQPNMDYEFKLLPGIDHGSVITAGMPEIFKFFDAHVKPEKK